MNDKGRKWLSYCLLFFISLLATYLLFYKGVGKGDDIKFHFANIMDEYIDFKDKNRWSPISGNIAMGLGVGNRLFYSPLPHLSVALLALFFDLFHLPMIVSFKVVLFLSVFFSGVLMFHCMLHMSKKNIVASLIAAGVYILYPYRLFDAFCRFAFAEAYSFIFLPLFFMGLYDVVHMNDESSYQSFIEVILGGSMLFLSHNLTAFYAFVFGILYLLFHIKKILFLFKKKKFIIHCALSVVFLIGLSSIMLFSQLELMNTNLYNITDRIRMWTDVNSVVKRVHNFASYSGFLNYPYLLGSYSQFFSKSSLNLELFLFIFFAILYLIIDFIFNKISKVKKYHFLLSTMIYILLLILFGKRIEFYLGGAIVFVFYGLYLFLEKHQFSGEKISTNSTFWYCISMLLVTFIMISQEFIWKILPDIFLNIQFPWRLWTFVQLFAALLIGILCTYYHPKFFLQKFFIIILGFLLVCNQPLLEKRLLYERQDNFETSTDWYVEINETFLDSGVALGFNKEYCPQVFFDANYESKYENSLYSFVKSRIRYDFYNYEDYSLLPVVLEGNSQIEIISAYAPNYQMTIQANEKSLIQMPLLYYPGYQINIIDDENNLTRIEGENVDGLLSFSLQEGTYQVNTKYVGTKTRKISYVYFSFSMIGVISLWVLILHDEKKKRQQMKNNNI